MRSIYKNKGFSLLELLLSIVLMVIIVGSAVTIFIGASNILGSSENKLAVFQNAREGLEITSKDVGNLTNDEGSLTVRNPNSVSSPQLIMKFTTTTSWIDPVSATNKTIRGEAQVFYYVINKNNKWVFKRHLLDITASSDPSNLDVSTGSDTLAIDVVCQFIHEDAGGFPAIRIAYFYYDNNDLRIAEPTPGSDFIFNNTDDAHNTPTAIRLSMDIEDTNKNIVRSLSRMIRINQQQ